MAKKHIMIKVEALLNDKSKLPSIAITKPTDNDGRNVIKFASSKGLLHNRNFFLSNSYIFKRGEELLIHDKKFITAEHCLQYYKFLKYHPDYAEEIRQTSTVYSAKILGSKNQLHIHRDWRKQPLKVKETFNNTKYDTVSVRSDWNNIRDKIMRKIVYQKFIQNKQLLMKLLSTGNKRLMYISNNDDHFGICNGKGENMMGKILEETRTQLSLK